MKFVRNIIQTGSGRKARDNKYNKYDTLFTCIREISFW